ncbi:hypothetical protein D6745_04125 [Candidatus Woesearchaeota archaeon]|nr:MAG: hypothetical protein D6745_04125 [Candidatus Woesearchaeota archaeon]
MGKLLWVLVIFLVIGGYMIFKGLGEPDLNDPANKKTFIKEFAKWLGQLFKSSKATVGAAAKQEWLPRVNKTNLTNETNKNR